MLYRASARLSEARRLDQDHWGPWLDRIADHFGPLSIAAFDHPKVRPIIRQWRNKYAETPRSADMGMQVFSRVCSYAVEQGKLTINPCEGIKALYAADRAAIIWTDADIARIKAVGSPELGHAIDLAALTGLRRGDLIRVCWSHVHANEICIPTNKSGRRVEARIPLYAELRAVLARIPKRATTILTNRKGQPWTNTGFGQMITAAKKQGRDRRRVAFP